ncbi:uncharacterized protein LOC118417796 [Branchiostoma floridae]|uniref:Uncharacterized protein LOC118417796 n=1 Tax=Branchiostoma floridae TaxID=7739 RepID=A0A9J7MSK9_BRAFL|nr:uncharacterized protein LOC118417796 [Branchiostoma floridae]
MSSQHTVPLLLSWTLLVVAVVRAVSAFPVGDSRPMDRQPRFVHYAHMNPYSPCERRGFRKDLQLTAKTIQRTNDTLTMMKQEVFMSKNWSLRSDFEEDRGLVALFRNLSSFEQTIPNVILEAQDLDDYSDTLRQSMHDTGSELNKLLIKLSITLRAAGEFGDQDWTGEPIPLPDVGGSLYWHHVRDFAFFQHLLGTLQQLKAQLEARLAEC